MQHRCDKLAAGVPVAAAPKDWPPPLPSATVVFCDNISSVYMAANPVHHRRTKHIELDIHFVREKVALGQFRVLHVPTTQPFADVMMKGLPTPVFEEFRSSLCIRPPDASAAAGCQKQLHGQPT